MSPSAVEARLARILTIYGFPPLALSVREDVVCAVFGSAQGQVSVDTPRPFGAPDATVASEIIILATKKGVKAIR